MQASDLAGTRVIWRELVLRVARKLDAASLGRRQTAGARSGLQSGRGGGAQSFGM